MFSPWLDWLDANTIGKVSLLVATVGFYTFQAFRLSGQPRFLTRARRTSMLRLGLFCFVLSATVLVWFEVIRKQVASPSKLKDY